MDEGTRSRTPGSQALARACALSKQVLKKVNATNSALKLLSSAGGVCLFGYVNALAVALRIALDMNSKRCSVELLDGTFQVQQREWLRVLQTLWRSPNMPLLLLDSSPWPFGLENISEIIAEAIIAGWRPPQLLPIAYVGAHPVGVAGGSCSRPSPGRRRRCSWVAMPHVRCASGPLDFTPLGGDAGERAGECVARDPSGFWLEDQRGDGAGAELLQLAGPMH
ncbi:unnamed protein product [Durusdinium trenchii]|uniref:Uncharacterized protein n=1 Tax=Durusdinium trenchii TaxID=1381693 RepID=A0ABP0JWN9_9DINO